MEKLIHRLSLIGILLLLAAMPVWAQSGKITGTVTDAQTGEPLPGANVVIEGTTIGAATDANGKYLILDVRPGTYNILARFIGYTTRKVENVVVRTELTTTLNFKLGTETLQGKEVVVQAKQQLVLKDVTSSEARVSSQEISKLPVQELGDVVKLQAGVNVDNGGGIHIRGGRSSEVSYVVDGIPVTDNYDHSQGLRIENQSVQELQVISGTFNAEYGQAMSGIINVVTKAGSNTWRGDIRGWGGNYLTGDGYVWDGIPTMARNYRPTNQYDYSANISGPIVKNRVTFFLTGRKFHNNGWLYGRNAYSPHGPYMDTLAANADLTNYRTLYNEQVDPAKSWYTLTPDTLRGRAFTILRDSGTRDSSLVNMNPYDSYSFQGNMQANISRKLKFNLIGAYGNEKGQDYNHNRRLVPYGDPAYYRENFSFNLKTTFTPGSRTYLTFNAAVTSNRYKRYLYDSPWDPRYFNYDNISTYGGVSPGGQYFFDELGTDNNRFKRRTKGLILKGEVTSQITDEHLVKAGVQFEADELSYNNINLQPLDEAAGIFLPESLPAAWQGKVQLGIPPDSTSNHQSFIQKPWTLSGFIQDKIEYKNLIVNVGLRLDYFQPNARIPADPRDPDINNPIRPANQQKTIQERQKYWWKAVNPKWQISPRLGVAYPVTANGVLHFSYGYFFQMPSYEYLYSNSQIILPQTAGIYGIFGNPNLKPESTVQYELGLKQQIFEGTAIEITGFYKDTRNYVSSGIIQQTENPSVYYGTYINRDFSNTKGLTFSLTQNLAQKINLSIDYTYTDAEGTNSDPTAAFFQATSQGDKTGQLLTKYLQILNWSRPSVLNGSLFYTDRTWGGSLLAKFESGTPYTPSTPFTVRTGPTASTKTLTNTARLPSRFSLDLTLYKNFTLIGSTSVQVFLNAYNLLGSKLINNVYPDSGEPTRPLIIPTAISSGYFNNPSYYAEPRRVQIGAQFSF